MNVSYAKLPFDHSTCVQYLYKITPLRSASPYDLVQLFVLRVRPHISLSGWHVWGWNCVGLLGVPRGWLIKKDLSSPAGEDIPKEPMWTFGLDYVTHYNMSS